MGRKKKPHRSRRLVLTLEPAAREYVDREAAGQPITLFVLDCIRQTEKKRRESKPVSSVAEPRRIEDGRFVIIWIDYYKHRGPEPRYTTEEFDTFIDAQARADSLNQHPRGIPSRDGARRRPTPHPDKESAHGNEEG